MAWCRLNCKDFNDDVVTCCHNCEMSILRVLLWLERVRLVQVPVTSSKVLSNSDWKCTIYHKLNDAIKSKSFNDVVIIASTVVHETWLFLLSSTKHTARDGDPFSQNPFMFLTIQDVVIPSQKMASFMAFALHAPHVLLLLQLNECQCHVVPTILAVNPANSVSQSLFLGKENNIIKWAQSIIELTQWNAYSQCLRQWSTMIARIPITPHVS